MDRFALLVDAGYFFKAGSEAAFGSPVKQGLLRLKDPKVTMDELRSRAAELCGGLPALRVYWYDAPPGPEMSLEQTAIADQTNVKVRLGVLNNKGEQKGVDSLIVTDLIELARNHAICDAVLISGDEDDAKYTRLFR